MIRSLNATLIGIGILSMLTTSLGAVEHHRSSPETRAKLEALITNNDRPERHMARDQYRHPLETLTFFGVEPELTVVEIWPGGQGGWYRRILERAGAVIE